MLDQILEQYRKAAESTMQFQHEMLSQLTRLLPSGTDEPTGRVAPPAPAPTRTAKPPERAAGTDLQHIVNDVLNRHRQALDAHYLAGISAIDDAFKLFGAKDPDQFRRLAEEMWKHTLDYLQKAVETQYRDIETALKEGAEAAAGAVRAAKK